MKMMQKLSILLTKYPKCIYLSTFVICMFFDVNDGFGEEPTTNGEAQKSIEAAAKSAHERDAEDLAKEDLKEDIVLDSQPTLGKRQKEPTKKTSKKTTAGAKAVSGKTLSKMPKKKRKVYPTNRPKRALKPSPALGKIPFPIGERLVYKVNLLNAHSGTVTLKVGQRGTYQGKNVVELSGFIQSSPFLENFYPIRDSLSVLVDEVNFLPLKSEFFLNEKGREITFISHYDHEKNLVNWKQKRVAKDKTYVQRADHQTPVSMYESLSSLYALRRIELKPGLNFEQYVWDGKRERLIELKVLGEERILTDLGWFETYKVELSSVITGGIVTRRLLKQAPVKGTAWIAKDAYHTPVKLITPTRLGQAEAVLTQRGMDTPQ